ncbi:unnamed protein product [Absidia cylindrospora]
MFSLYGDLPAPKTKNDTEGAQSTNQDNANGSDGSPSSTTSVPMTKSTPTGWSNMQQFRPVMRKPTIQAKPKLFKPVIPAGATIVSTTTVNKDDPELNSTPSSTLTASKPTTHQSSSPAITPSTTIRPLHTKSYTSTQDNVNGFRQNKKKGKLAALQNQGPPPIDLTEDYDPLRPTNYEQYKEEMEVIKQQEQRQYAQQRRSSSRRQSSYSSDESSRSQSPSPRRPKHLYNTSSSSSTQQQRHENGHLSKTYRPFRIPHRPSPSNGNNNTYITESGNDAYNRRAMLSQQPSTRSMELDTHQTTSTASGLGENMAWKMMNKYGWQEGQGLGRDANGIREALQVQARGDGSGVILPQKTVPSTRQPQQQQRQQRHQQLSIVSPVVVLKNLVGPGEVDDLLQQETADECQKYGHVEQCLIYEVPDGRVKDEEAVRIFVKFSHLQSAINAISDMNGRYFGGRVVSAETYDQDRFDKLDLAPVV